VSLAKNAQVGARKLATQLKPINHNFIHSRCNIIAKLSAVPHLQLKCCNLQRQQRGPVDVLDELLGAPSAMVAEAALQAEYR